MFFIFLILFIGCAHAQDVDTKVLDEQIKSLDDQAQVLLLQRKTMIEDWKQNDPDMQLLERLKEKTRQQRVIADQANELLKQKEELVKQKEEILKPKEESAELSAEISTP